MPYTAAYRETHKEQIKASKKAYREAHKEEIKAYRVAHKDERAAYTRAWRIAERNAIEAIIKKREEEGKGGVQPNV